MATKKKNSSSRTTTKSTKKQTQRNDRQFYAVIWFAVAIFLGCVVFIKGENVWLALHNCIFGVFGVTAYLYPFLLAIVAVLVSMDRCGGSIGAKVWETVTLAVLVGACVDACTVFRAELKFSEHIAEAYAKGYKCGGAIGAILGHPLCFAFGKVCAIIVFALLIFVILMAITGTTLGTLFHWAAKPVQMTKEQAESNYEARARRREEQEKEAAKNGGRNMRMVKFNVNQPLTDDPNEIQQVKETTPEEKQRHLVSTYRGDDEIPEEAPPKRKRASKKNVDVSVAGEAESARSDESVSADGETADAVPFDAAAEEAEMTEKITSGIKMVEEDDYRFPPLSLLKAPDFRSGGMNSAEHMNQTGER